ncbi:hypothetical protein ABT337_31370 [Saccharopolyspora hirsuta]|uniref:Uncharacterized protein n=1 Tax=Saccharopolyspora hirsuta TaxID=1837 RepID=A0A5M7BVK6_SACHI|nr:hypothetical protein [Saccharopolyspora hirsuta]KAA5833473.1 hypothetical protein F1721_14405 [Saccharopolyspora hirsuta]
MSDSPSEAVLAARRKFDEISTTTAAKLSESAQRSIESSEKAKESTKNFTERLHKLEDRVRDLIAQRDAARGSEKDNEIQVGSEDDEEPQDEIAVEYADLIANYPSPEPAGVTPAAASPVSSDSAQVGLGAQVPQGGADQQQADSRWQVQAGRFGRRDQQVSAPQPPPVPPKPPAAPKPAPRRQPAFDDDDDYENQSWLR